MIFYQKFKNKFNFLINDSKDSYDSNGSILLAKKGFPTDPYQFFIFNSDVKKTKDIEVGTL